MGKYVVITLLAVIILSSMPFTLNQQTLCDIETYEIKESSDDYYWGYFLVWYDDVVFTWVAGTKAKILVVDPDNGPLNQKWQMNDIFRLKENGMEVYAYLNVMFAEDWRNYFNKNWLIDPPDWFTNISNPGWPGEYYVKFWYSDWYSIMINETKRIMSLGFNGLLFDNLDAFYFWEENMGIPNAMELEIEFVCNLTSFLRENYPYAKVIGNIGAGLELIENDTFCESIDVVLREEVWYSLGEPVDPDETSYVLEYLRLAKSKGLEAAVLDYVIDYHQAEIVLSNAKNEGFLAMASFDYGLSSLPPYVPSYHAVRLVRVNSDLYAFWSYHGYSEEKIYGNWTIFMAQIDDEIVQTIEIGEGESVAVDYNPMLDVFIVVWENCDENEDIYASIVNTEGKVLEKLQLIGYDGNQHSPDVAFFGDYFLLVYCDDSRYEEMKSNIYLVYINKTYDIDRTLEIAVTERDEFYPRIFSNGTHAIVLWISDDELWSALVNENGVLWKRKLASGIMPYSYSAVYVEDQEAFLVLYRASDLDESRAFLIDGHGNAVCEIPSLPPICYESNMVSINNKIYYVSKMHIVELDLDYGEYRILKNINTISITGTWISCVDNMLWIGLAAGEQPLYFTLKSFKIEETRSRLRGPTYITVVVVATVSLMCIFVIVYRKLGKRLKNSYNELSCKQFDRV